MPLRITAIWLLLLFVAVINGAIRETFMTALLGVPAGNCNYGVSLFPVSVIRSLYFHQSVRRYYNGSIFTSSTTPAQ